MYLRNFTLAIGLLLSPILVSQTVREDIDLIHRGSANAIALEEGKLYLGGNFNGIGTYSGCGAVVDEYSGKYQSGWPVINSEVHVSIPDGHGGWFIGGIFSSVGGVKRNKVAHINADKTIDPVFKYDIAGEVYGLAKRGDTLYIAGYFAERLIAVNISTGKRVSNWNPIISGDYKSVQHLILFDTLLCALGDFDVVDGSPRNHFALLDARSGKLLPYTQDNIAYPYRVAFVDSLILLNALFKDSLGTEKKYILARNLVTELIEWTIPYTGNVYGFIVYDSALYVSGENLVVLDSLQSLVTINPANGATYNWKSTVARSWTRMNVTPQTILGSYYDTTFSVNRVTGVQSGWNPAPNNIVRTISSNGPLIFIGGDFSTINPRFRKGFAVIDEATGRVTEISHSFSLTNAFMQMEINTIKVKDSVVYISGRFDSVDSFARENFAAIDLKNKSVTPFTLEFDGTDEYSAIYAMDIADTVLVVGGLFKKINGQLRQNLAAISLRTGSVLEWAPNPSHAVHCIRFVDSLLFIGGSFDSIYGEHRTGVAMFKNFEFSGWNPKIYYHSTLPTILDIMSFQSYIYISGSFSSVDSMPRNNLASFDISTGVLTTWNPNAGESVHRMSHTSDAVITLGAYNMNGIYQNGVFALDPIVGKVINGWNPWPTLGISSAVCSDQYVYLTGNFIQVGPIPTNNRRMNGFAGISLPVVTSVAPMHATDTPNFLLDQNFPNPFNPETTISFSIPRQAHITLTVFDVLGREVSRIVNSVKVPGSYQIPFDGSGLSGGIYFYQMQIENRTITKKMILLK